MQNRSAHCKRGGYSFTSVAEIKYAPQFLGDYQNKSAHASGVNSTDEISADCAASPSPSSKESGPTSWRFLDRVAEHPSLARTDYAPATCLSAEFAFNRDRIAGREVNAKFLESIIAAQVTRAGPS